MSYVIDSTIAIDLTATSESPTQALGTVLTANDGVYQYIQAGEAITQYALVKIPSTDIVVEGTTTLLPATEPASVGIAQVEIAEDYYGWVFVGPGKASCLLAASCAEDVKLYTTATAGVVDDASTTLIEGLTSLETITTARAATVLATKRLATAS